MGAATALYNVRWRGAKLARRCFSARPDALKAKDLRLTLHHLQHLKVARYRLVASRARHDNRVWQVKRRERTRQLIELGGLVAKSGLIELTEDDRAVIFGIMLEAVTHLHGQDKERLLMVWRRRGKRAFEADTIKDNLL
jgi:hypothetical protein